MDSLEEFDDAGYSVLVGERLRSIRKQKRLSLHDVEAQSSQEFKASVLGAYERGERALSLPAARPAGAVLPRARRPAAAAPCRRPGSDVRASARARSSRSTS
jgi:transcriptional regulator with XRE-family HTH domain